MAKKPGLGERACPKCKETIKADALICKHCRTEFSAEEVVAAKAAKQRDAKYAGFGCLGLVLLLGFCGYVAGDGGAAPAIPDRPGPTAKADVSEFYRKVMDVVQPCDQAGKRMAEAASAARAIVQAARAARCAGFRGAGASPPRASARIRGAPPPRSLHIAQPGRR